MCRPTAFPPQHRTKLHSTNSLERLNGEIKRRSDVVGIFPNEAAVVRLIGALLLEQNDEWTAQRCRCMPLESIAPLGDNPSLSALVLVTAVADAPGTVWQAPVPFTWMATVPEGSQSFSVDTFRIYACRDQ